MNNHLDTTQLAFIPLSSGLSFKPLTYFEGDAGYQILLRLEPGTVIPPHRHSGEVHAYNLTGTRLLIDSQQVIGPGGYVHEPVGNVDTWKAIGSEPCTLHLEVHGRIEYLGDDGSISRTVDARTFREAYLAWCDRTGTPVAPALSPRATP